MSKYQIESKAGVVYGIYEGETEADAFKAMVEEAGTGAEGTPDDWLITCVDLTLSQSGQILIGAHFSGYGVKQTKGGTVVYVTDDGRRAGKPDLTLPHARYALSCDAPASGNPGAAQFKADFLAALAKAR